MRKTKETEKNGMIFGEAKRPYRTERAIFFKKKDGIRGFAFSDKASIRVRITNVMTAEKEEKIETLIDEMGDKLKEIIAAD